VNGLRFKALIAYLRAVKIDHKAGHTVMSMWPCHEWIEIYLETKHSDNESDE